MIVVDEVRDTESFAKLAPAWTQLLARSADANPFLSHEWLHAWWLAYQPSAELRILVARDGDRVIGIAPLMEQKSGIRSMLRILSFIGDGTSETDHIGFLLERDKTTDIADALLEAVYALPWNALLLNQITEKSTTAKAILSFFQARGDNVDLGISPCPVRRLPSTYEALLASLPARFRTALRSTRRRLADQYTVHFGLHDTTESVNLGLETLFKQHAGRWKLKNQSGVFVDAKKCAFYKDMAARFLARDWLRFYYLKLDDRIVAQQFCFQLDGCVLLLQEGFDPAHVRDNVGNALRSMVFERLIEEQVPCYDFLAGASRHKTNWSDHIVNDLLITIARKGWSGWLYRTPIQTRKKLTAWLRPWRDLLVRRNSVSDHRHR